MDNDITTINDRVVKGDNPVMIEAKEGERIKIRFANIGYLPHKVWYPDGFVITHEDGYPLPEQREETTLTIFPGKRHDMVVSAKRTGRYLFYHSITIPQGDLAKEASRGHQFHDTEHHIQSHNTHKSQKGRDIKEVPLIMIDVTKNGGGE